MPNAQVDELLQLGLTLEPEMPAIVDGTPDPNYTPAAGVPFVDFRDDEVITEWLCACPIKDRTGVDFSARLMDGHDNEFVAKVIAQLGPLDRKYIVEESFPDFKPAIDLRAMADGEDGVPALFHAVLKNDRERLVRACVDGVGEGVVVKLWLNGESLPHGGFVRLKPGTHCLVMETGSGKLHYAWQWAERRVCPRFTAVEEEDVRGVHEWLHGLWQKAYDAAQSDDSELVKDVEIDPDTIRGKEGFIRVGKSRNGVWWLIDPAGNPFYYKAMCSVNNRGGTGGRRKGDPLLPDNKVDHWLRIMKSWGFNGLGSWTTRDFFDRGFIFTENIESFYEGPYVRGGGYGRGITPDVWSPKWIENVDKKCLRVCAYLKDSKQLLGYFIDNERGFHKTRVPEGVSGPTYQVGDMPEKRQEVVVAAEPILNPEALGMLQLVLSVDQETPACVKGWEFIEERYGPNIEDLGKAWGVELKSRLSINEMTINGERLVSEAYLRDEDGFLKLWIEQYFKVTTEAIRRHDPNHLVIGVRWAGAPGPLVLDEEVKWVDTLSLNRYRAEVVEGYDHVYRRAQTPIIMGELCHLADAYPLVRNPIEPPGGYDSVELRGLLRTNDSFERVCRHPGIVGYTFYAWHNGVRHPDDMRPLQRLNWRAATERMLRERGEGPLGPVSCPLNGQVFVTLVGGRGNALPLGFVCRDGKWDEEVRGNGLLGKMTEFEEEDGTIRMKVEYRRTPGTFANSNDEGSCTITLRRTNATELEGEYEGVCEHGEISGAVLGYLHRPVATTRV